MYRQGLGDCFLISLPRNDGGSRPFYVMIDCGVVLGTPDPGTIMKQVMDNIVEVTGGQIDILVATHEHWDHLSGFVQAAESFDKLKVGQVWLAWTEDEKDELTQKIRKEKDQALTALRMGLSQMQLAGAAGARRTRRNPGILRCRQGSDDRRRPQERPGQGQGAGAALLPADRSAGCAGGNRCAVLCAGATP